MKDNIIADSYKKGDMIELDIIDMSTTGEGIGKTGAFTWFVKDSLVGDRVSAFVMKSKKNYGYARLNKVLRASKDRIEPKCSVARACGGCSLQNMSYESQLELKDKMIINNLIRIGKFSKDFFVNASDAYDIPGVCIHYPIIGMEEPWRYRNKSIYPVAVKKDSAVYGFYAARTHSVIEPDDCLIGIEENKPIMEAVMRFIKKYGIAVYDEVHHRGIVRNVLIRKGFTTGELMVCVVINADKLPHTDKLVDILLKAAHIKSISYNVNTAKGNVILGEKEVNIYGDKYIYDHIGDIKFRISAKSFFQVNPVQTRKLYDTVLEFADLSKEDTVWDLYCGIGSISLYMSKQAGKVYGIEIVKAAVEDALDNAKLNKIENTKFLLGEAEKVLPELYDRAKVKVTDKKSEDYIENALSVKIEKEYSMGGIESIPVKDILEVDCLVLDPPRKGCDKACLDTILKIKPERIVYVSCDSATLARDLEYLCEKEYELRKVRGVDMFGWSMHCETVVLMSRKDK
jgi:23S rRNA (uracil-5-)-methyltransferase rumA